MGSNRHLRTYLVAIRELGLAHHLVKSIVLRRHCRKKLAIDDTDSKTSEDPDE